MIQSLKNIKSKRDLNNNHGIGQESEIETLQNALQEAMLRERQLIQEKAQKEDEMKQQRDATKQYIEVLMKEKKELLQNIENMKNTQNTQNTQKPPSKPPPSTPNTISPLKQLEIEAEQNKKDL